jgi:hypothetical protein
MLAVPFLTACAAGQLIPASLVRPSVRLHHLAIRNIGLAGGTVDVVLAVYNPNRFTIRGTRLEADISIEEHPFGDVALSEPLQLEQRDTTLISAPLTFQWSGVGAAARSVLDYGAVNYEIAGRLLVDLPTGGQPLAVPFSGAGNVPLLGLGRGGRQD